MSFAGRTVNSINHIESYRIHQAVREIKYTYGYDVAIKQKDLLMYGQNVDVGTSSTTIMTLISGQLNETYVSSNLINRLSSSNNSDAQPVTVEGHTISNGLLSFKTQTVTLTGQTPVALTTPLARCTRIYDSNGASLLGNIYAFQSTSAVVAGVPSDGTKVHAIIPAGSNQTKKCSTSTSAYDFFLISSFGASLNKKTAANADLRIEFRQIGHTFKTNIELSIGTDGSSYASFDGIEPLIIIPNNSDVRMVAEASTSGVSITSNINGYFAYILNPL